MHIEAASASDLWSLDDDEEKIRYGKMNPVTFSSPYKRKTAT